MIPISEIERVIGELETISTEITLRQKSSSKGTGYMEMGKYDGISIALNKLKELLPKNET